METLELTKLQARTAIGYRSWAYDIAKRYNQEELKSRMNYDKDIQEVNGKLYYVIKTKQGNYSYLMENHDIPKIFINDHEVSLGYLEGFLNDLTRNQQEEILKNLPLDKIEEYLSNRCGRVIKLKRFMSQNKKGEPVMALYTDDLIEKTGICKAMLKNIFIESRDIGYYIDYDYTGEQKLSYMRFDFRYEHQDGGSNGHEIGTVRLNKDEEFEGWNYESEKWELI